MLPGDAKKNDAMSLLLRKCLIDSVSYLVIYEVYFSTGHILIIYHYTKLPLMVIVTLHGRIYRGVRVDLFSYPTRTVADAWFK